MRERQTKSTPHSPALRSGGGQGAPEDGRQSAADGGGGAFEPSRFELSYCCDTEVAETENVGLVSRQMVSSSDWWVAGSIPGWVRPEGPDCHSVFGVGLWELDHGLGEVQDHLNRDLRVFGSMSCEKYFEVIKTAGP